MLCMVELIGAERRGPGDLRSPGALGGRLGYPPFRVIKLPSEPYVNLSIHTARRIVKQKVISFNYPALLREHRFYPVRVALLIILPIFIRAPFPEGLSFVFKELFPIDVFYY
jgi:hypothetical protein